MNRIITILLLILGFSFSLQAQDYERFQKRNARQKAKLERAEKQGKVSEEEKTEIERRNEKLERLNRKAVRNGDVNEREQAKLNRNLRKVKRETRRAKK